MIPKTAPRHPRRRLTARDGLTTSAAILAVVALGLVIVGSAGARAGDRAGLRVTATEQPGPSSIIVGFRSSSKEVERQTLLDALGHEQVDELELPRAGIHAKLIQLPEGESVEAAIARYARHPLVEYAEPNGSNPLASTFPNDPLFADQWGLDNTGQIVNGQTGVPDADIDGPEGWARQTGSTSIVVGVADTGIQYDHPELAAQIWTNPGETGVGLEDNNIDDDQNGYRDDWRGWDWVSGAPLSAGSGDNDPRDHDGHGTHVAGTIGARGNNGIGVTGVNWRVKLMPLRICGADGCQQWRQAKAFAYAGQMGAHVVNASLGGPASSTTVSEAILNSPNTLFVFAAGNEASNNDATPVYPCQYELDNIVCVAASTMNDGLAGFSNWGATSVDLAAPGSNVLSTDIPASFRDTFNADANQWTFSGTNNTWGWVDDGAGGGYLSDSPGAQYANNTDSYATITNPLDLTGRTGCKLNYFIRYISSLSDYLETQVSTNGTTWTALQRWEGNSGGAWLSVQHDLSAYNGQPSLHVRFYMHSDGSSTAPGFDLDTVAVQCTTSPPNLQNVRYDSGTSMAAPHVAGAAALLKAHAPSATSLQIKQALLAGVDPKPAFAGKTVTGGRLNVNTSLQRILEAPRAPADFDANGSTDVSVFRPGNGVWYVRGGAWTPWGQAGDVPVPADYDGDGDDDVAVFRPGDGFWYVNGGPWVQWGQNGDVPAPGDYDGDGDDEIAVWRPSDGVWYVRGGPWTQWGQNGDIPVPADYDGDGTTDLAVWRPSDGVWYVRGGVWAQWGQNGDIPVVGDYNGDDADEVAVFRPADGFWYVRGGIWTQWGQGGDLPVPGDYDGDGDTEVAVWRPGDGVWYVRGGAWTQWGQTGDKPLPPLPSVARLLYP